MTKFSSFLFVLLMTLASFTANAQEHPRGDANLDGAVNITDVTSLINYLLNGSWPDEPVTPPDNHEWVDLGLPSGTLWATCNVGATSPEEYGDYFAWGETSPKSAYSIANYKWCKGSYVTLTKYCTQSGFGYNGFTDGKAFLDLEDDAAYVNWGPLWRVPYPNELNELLTQCTWSWTSLNGVNGCQGTGPNGNTIFLPAAGYRSSNSLNAAGEAGEYWSNTITATYSTYAYYMLVGRGRRDVADLFRDKGLTVRAVRVSED